MRALFVAALVFGLEVVDGFLADDILELRAEEVCPAEVVTFEVEALFCATGAVVSRASARVGEDGVGKGDLLELGVRRRFVGFGGLVY